MISLISALSFCKHKYELKLYRLIHYHMYTSRLSLMDLFMQIFLCMQTVALCACTTLVSIEPRLPMETRNRVMKVCFAVANVTELWQYDFSFSYLHNTYDFELFYVPFSGNLRFFCFAN